MKVLKILLIFLWLKNSAKAQNSLSKINEEHHDIYKELIANEAGLRASMDNIVSVIDITIMNLCCFDDFYYLIMELNQLMIKLRLQSTISDYGTLKQVVNCKSVRNKITELAVEEKKLNLMVVATNRNMTDLNNQLTWLTYRFLLASNAFEPMKEVQQDVAWIISNTNVTVIRQMMYINKLKLAEKLYSNISQNLEEYLANNCKCANNVKAITKVSQNLPTLESMEQDIVTQQDIVKDAASTVSSQARKIKNSKKYIDRVRIIADKIFSISSKIVKNKDLAPSTIPKTKSCNTIERAQVFMQTRRFKYLQAMGLANANNMLLSVDKSFLDGFTWSINVTKDYEKLQQDVIALTYGLSNYSSELSKQLEFSSKVSFVVDDYNMMFQQFCVCRDSGNNTTTSVQATTTTMSTSVSAKLSTLIQQSSSKAPDTSSSKKTEPTSSIVTTSSPTTSRATTSITSSTSTSVLQTTKPNLPQPSSDSTTTLPTTTSRTTRTTTSTTTTPTTTLDPNIPPNADQCDFTKALYDRNSKYLKSACLYATPSNGSYSNYFCQANGMRLMNIDANITQMAVTIFIQETISEGYFWINGPGGPKNCGILMVNASSFIVSNDRCVWYEYLTICEYKDPNATAVAQKKVNMDGCGTVVSVYDDIIHETKIGCLFGYTRSYDMSDYNCQINGMKMFSLSGKEAQKYLSIASEDILGVNSGALIWINGTYSNDTCNSFNGNYSPFAVESADCNLLFWSYCEVSYKDVQF